MKSEKKEPKGTLYVMDPSPLNWLYVLFNVMEEAVRADHEGRVIPSLAERLLWIDEKTLELSFRKGVSFHNGETFNADYVLLAFKEEDKWIAPHPPGTWVNLPTGTTLEKMDLYTVRFHFPEPQGIAPGKLRAHHYPTVEFWKRLGFGYKKLGTAEGHW